MSILGSLGLSALGGLFGIAGSSLSNKQQYKYQSQLNEQQFGYNQELMSQDYGYNSQLQQEQAALNEQAAISDYERQLDYWNKQNEYNLPENEIQRLKDAGLSVGLMYSGSGASSGATASAGTQAGTGLTGVGLPGSSAGQAVTQPYDLDFVARILDIRNKELQNESLEVQIPRTEAETKNLDTVSAMNEVLRRRNDIQLEMDKIDAEFKNWNLSNLKTMSNAEVLSKQNELEMQLLEIANLGYITKQNELGVKFQEETFDVSVAIMEMGYKEQAVKIISALAQIESIKKGIELTDAQIQELEQQIEWNPLIWTNSMALNESITQNNQFRLQLNKDTKQWQELEKKYNAKMARRNYRYMPFKAALDWITKIGTAAAGAILLGF
ncbi:MAG: hypothetical protein LUG21_05645 [Clostridiales bacterium]|nr:hypothetical protein [Clostridiales bacterium]